MKTKSWMTIGVVIAGFILASCQSTPETAVINGKPYIPPKVLIESHTDTDNDGVPDIIDNCPNTPEGVVTDEYGCPVAVNLIGPLMMEIRVFFERNSTEFKVDDYLTEINKVAEKIREYPELITVLSGHVSKLEAVEIQIASNKQADQIKFDNSQLARTRVQLVKDRLINQGIAADKIHTFDCGYSMQIAPNDTEEGASMNQRVFGTVMEATEIYANDNYSGAHSFKRYKEVCQEF